MGITDENDIDGRREAEGTTASCWRWRWWAGVCSMCESLPCPVDLSLGFGGFGGLGVGV